jgi:hypothetical protein
MVALLLQHDAMKKRSCHVFLQRRASSAESAPKDKTAGHFGAPREIRGVWAR